MLSVSKKSQYGLRAMIQLARNYKAKKILSINLISQKEGIPFDFLEKIVLHLKRAKLVKGKKGFSGGYILSSSPNKISIKDIINTLEGENPIVDCLFCKKFKKCVAKSVWAKVENSLNKTLGSIKLSDLIK